MTHKAEKVVIITEKVIFDGVVEVIEAAGATGYTMVAAAGKGSRGVRTEGRAQVVDALRNVKIEVICSSREQAETIAENVSAKYFKNYSGITYLEEVEILRPGKFSRGA
jgi:nitrogen regulatory protein PII